MVHGIVHNNLRGVLFFFYFKKLGFLFIILYNETKYHVKFLVKNMAIFYCGF